MIHYHGAPLTPRTELLKMANCGCRSRTRLEEVGSMTIQHRAVDMEAASKRWKDDLSASQIAKRFGVSRNVIIGIVFRNRAFFPEKQRSRSTRPQKAEPPPRKVENAQTVHSTRERTSPGLRLRCEAFAICKASRGFASSRMQVAPQQRRPIPFLRSQDCREILPTPSIESVSKPAQQEAEVIMPMNKGAAVKKTSEVRA